jgi:hypothetical protein
MASRNTEEGQLAWGRLSEASQVELFLGSRGKLFTARTSIPRDTMERAPRGERMSQSFQGEL